MKKIFILFFILFVSATSGLSKNHEDYMYKKTILIDLDGVLNNYTGKYSEDIPTIKEGAKDFIIKLSKYYKLILFTTRNSKKANDWLVENDVDQYFDLVTNIKMPAYIYIDDRAINFEGNYSKMIEDIKNFKVYWQ